MSECYRKYFYYNDIIKPTVEFDSHITNFGTTVYEVIRIKECVPLFIEKYFKRLKNTANLAGVEIWLSDKDIEQRIRRIIEANCVLEEDSLKIVFSFDNKIYGKPQNIFMAYFMRNNAPTPEQFRNGVLLVSMQAVRENPNAKVFSPSLRKNSVKIINKYKAYEAVLIDEDNFVTEGSRSNIFFIKDNKLYTTKVDKVLPGVTRDNIIEIAKENKINFEEKNVLYDELNNYDAVFITGTSRKVVPVRQLDNFYFDVNNELLRHIMQLYANKIRKYLYENKHKWTECKNCT